MPEKRLFLTPINTRDVFLTGTKKDQRRKLLILFVLYGSACWARTSDSLINSQCRAFVNCKNQKGVPGFMKVKPIT